MLISSKGRYALRLMIYIAALGDAEGKIALREVADREHISQKYLEQLVRPLMKAGLLKSVRGKGGGYMMAKDPSEVRAGDILRAVDGAVIRGEDSFVRAQLAGTPLLWATYPTEDKAHEIKLDAWLARFREAWPADAAVPFETYEAASRHWVDGTLEPAEVKAWLDQLPVQKRAAEVWRESLLRRGDLARRILELVPRA